MSSLITSCIFFLEAHSENTLSVSYITDESGGQIAVVPLDKEVDKSKVYVIPDSEDKHVEGEGEDEDTDKDKDDVLEEEEDMEIEEGNDSDEDDRDSQGDDDDDDDDDYDDDEDDDDKMDDSDDDYIPKNQKKSARMSTTKNTDDEVDSSDVADDKIASGKRRKKTGPQKKKPSIREIVSVDADSGAGTLSVFSSSYRCKFFLSGLQVILKVFIQL